MKSDFTAHTLVAGAGVEPASGGYEPPEVPFLYPAMVRALYRPSA